MSPEQEKKERKELSLSACAWHFLLHIGRISPLSLFFCVAANV